MTIKGRRSFASHPGKLNGRAVLSEEQAIKIKLSCNVGAARVLGESFGITKAAADSIFYGRTWKHLNDLKGADNE